LDRHSSSFSLRAIALGVAVCDLAFSC
jgi:hypothetical protein